MALHLPAHSLQDAPVSPVLNLTLSSAHSFATATTQGWAIYKTNPLTTLSYRELANASLKIVLPLGQSNLLFLVGGPPTPLYAPNKVMVFDEKLAKAVAELEFREEVRGLAARKDRLVVVLRRRVVVFGLGVGPTGLWREGSYETTDNSAGLVALSTDEGSTLLAFPGRQPGQVQIVRLPPLSLTTAPLPPPPSHDSNATPFPSVSIIVAHTTSLSALSTNPSGSLIATASSKGTLIRIWDPRTAKPLKELRRGTDSAQIFGIALRPDGGAVAVSSDKGTVHVWDLGSRAEDRQRSAGSAERDKDESRRQKQLNILKPYLPKYFSSEWSHSQFRLPPPAPPPSRLPFSLSAATEANQAGAAGGGAGSRSATPTVEDDVCICAWVEVDVPEEVEQLLPGASGKGKARAVSQPQPQPAPQPRDRDRRRQSSADQHTPARAGPTATATSYEPSSTGVRKQPRKEHQIVALTHSGGWFRISLGHHPASDHPAERAAAEPAPTGPHNFGLGKDSTHDCRLEEYRRFGSKDGW